MKTDKEKKGTKKGDSPALHNLCREKILSLNPKGEPLTVERLRSMEDLHHLSEEEADGLLLSIQILTGILYDILLEQENAENNSNNDQNKIAA